MSDIFAIRAFEVGCLPSEFLFLMTNNKYGAYVITIA